MESSHRDKGGDVEIHIQPKNRPRWAFAQHKLTSSGRPHLEWTKHGKLGGLWVVLAHSPVRSKICLILFFAHKDSNYKTNTYISSPQTQWLLLRAIRKQGWKGGWGIMKQRLQTSRRRHQKLVSCRGSRDGYQWLELEGIGWWLRVWGRGQSNLKVCILAAGWDTSAERGGLDDHHGWEVEKNKVMVGVMCACMLASTPIPLPPCSLQLFPLWWFQKMAKTFISRCNAPLFEILVIYRLSFTDCKCRGPNCFVSNMYPSSTHGQSE
jgi:hypothetical protein